MRYNYASELRSCLITFQLRNSLGFFFLVFYLNNMKYCDDYFLFFFKYSICYQVLLWSMKCYVVDNDIFELSRICKRVDWYFFCKGMTSIFSLPFWHTKLSLYFGFYSLGFIRITHFSIPQELVLIWKPSKPTNLLMFTTLSSKNHNITFLSFPRTCPSFGITPAPPMPFPPFPSYKVK